VATISVSAQRSKTNRAGGTGIRYYGTSGQNSADTFTTTVVAEHHRQKLQYVAVAYSGAPTQTGVLVTLDSGLGSGYDTLLATGDANGRYTVYIPDSGDCWIDPGDAVLVNIPAGGGSLTATVQVVVEEV